MITYIMPFEEGYLWCSDCQGSRKFTSRREARFLIHLLCKGADNGFYGKSRISNNQSFSISGQSPTTASIY